MRCFNDQRALIDRWLQPGILGGNNEHSFDLNEREISLLIIVLNNFDSQLNMQTFTFFVVLFSDEYFKYVCTCFTRTNLNWKMNYVQLIL